MKYYLIAGEASGDLHASRLMQALARKDPQAEFRFIGGDLMAAAGGTMVRHYRELAYMGFIPVLLHLPTILRNMRLCKRDISKWQPDVVILVDYPGFNLSIAKYVHALSQPTPKVYYYIAPKIWAWKEYRIKNIRRDVDELFSILPFEVDFFEGKHHYPIHYVGNPTADEVRTFLNEAGSNDKPKAKKVIALLAGSRRQEIKDNLPTMIEAARQFEDDYELVLAGAPGIESSFYEQFTTGTSVRRVDNQTYALLSQAHTALVTSGTATLETALFGVPQVVCYETPLPRLIGWLRKKVLKVKYISLVNLIANREVVRELVADSFTLDNIRRELAAILPDDAPARRQMLEDYQQLWQQLGDDCAPEKAATTMYQLLTRGKANED
ncbi:MAG: lipid-A-disaccharide synthase [Prevotella sp.]|nr:lipid-A-disaccharide synthase [Prevotella sp.]